MHQRYFVRQFAEEIYDKILSDPNRKTFLDVGCNTGEQSMMFLESHPRVQYVGIDREKCATERGAELFPQATYFNVDIEQDDLDEKLSEIEEELDIEGFDVINVSMVLLHVKRPRVLIDALCDHLSDNGKLIILDIDDGLNIAYPDQAGDFRKAIDVCYETKYSGYRHSGRQIYEFLSKQNLDNIVLEKAGMSTVGMSRIDKGHFFDIYFWFVLDDLRKMHAENPDNKLVQNRLEWMEGAYKQMRMNFKERGFFFNLGFMIYTAG
jgi:SAM-dependent methyltransferase